MRLIFLPVFLLFVNYVFSFATGEFNFNKYVSVLDTQRLHDLKIMISAKFKIQSVKALDNK